MVNIAYRWLYICLSVFTYLLFVCFWKKQIEIKIDRGMPETFNVLRPSDSLVTPGSAARNRNHEQYDGIAMNLGMISSDYPTIKNFGTMPV